MADRYLDALESELRMRLRVPQAVETVFVGGGTPTRLTCEQLERMTRMIAFWLPLYTDGEWTVEANPGTLDVEKVDVLASAGVNRISLGAQSFDREALLALERNHDPDDVPRALDLVRPRFDRWSLDLIFGVPGSTLDIWKRDLEITLAFQPDHLSCYGLVFEKGTPLWKSRALGQVQPLDEDIELAMYEHTIDRLSASGLEQYEISNFARAGHACRHNLFYWANAPYFGFGLGAARYVDGERAVNTRDLLAYLKRIEAGDDPTGPRERLDQEPRARETAVLMLRRTQVGLDRAEFLARTGFEIDALCKDDIERSVRSGLLDDDGRRIRFTPRGVFLADTVLSSLL